MDIATLVGLLGAIAMVVMAMVIGGSVLTFIDVPSILIVVVGTHFVIMMKYSLGDFLGAASSGMKVLTFKSPDCDELIEKIVELADMARKSGLLALEGADISDPFMKKGIGLLVDGHDGDVVQAILEKDVQMASQRHANGAGVFKSMADIAPAMGMIGTLIGLVAMLSNMDDPKSIGPAMAVALLTTLYGAIMANMVGIPIADKLNLRDNEEKISKKLVIDGLLGIQAGQNPRVIEQVLHGYLAESKRPSAEE
ncbi:flagellar motor protein PomA [Aliikangiella coralliicola]|uniref:Flagellar motor protein PomA n=1 Tax=Aliikangiella coralliicola TaxID=2592383 RepID=A0A545U7X3_9GAMM|nr:flagellar motor protein PomA [Aliikangiella coralliicola]TQV85566.1 flagellar motor protein PomA [Aliikangiella coralliicola]